MSGSPFHRALEPSAATTGSSLRSSLVALVVVLSLLLFVAGFFLGEDALGGGVRDDLYIFHGLTMVAFRDKPFFTVLQDYTSATTPLFQILESFNPLLGHDTWFRATNIIFCLLTVVLFVAVVSRRFRHVPASVPIAALLGSSILLSPYFRAESYWVSTDVFPIFLLLLTALLLHSIEEAESPGAPLLVPAALALLSWSTFYCRQSYLFLPFFVFCLLLWRLPERRLSITLLFTVCGLPALYLVHLWGGLNPPSFKRHQGFALEGIAAPLSMVFIYAVPFLLDALLRSRHQLTARLFARRRLWLSLLVGLLVFVAVFHGFHFNARHEGGGIASKILEHLGRPGRYLFLLLSYLGLVILFFLARGASWKGRVLLLSFFAPTFIMAIFFQRYYDPLLIMAFFALWERDSVQRFFTPRLAVFLILFNVLLLVGAVAYNVRSKPVFAPLSSYRPAVNLGR